MALLQMEVNALTKEVMRLMTTHSPLHLNKLCGTDRWASFLEYAGVIYNGWVNCVNSQHTNQNVW